MSLLGLIVGIVIAIYEAYYSLIPLIEDKPRISSKLQSEGKNTAKKVRDKKND